MTPFRRRARERTPSPTDRAPAHRVRRWRRVAAILCGALAVGAGVQAAAPPPPETTAVLVAAADISPGTALGPEHLRTVELPQDSVAWEAAPPEELTGRTVAVPLAPGDPVTPRSLLPTGGQVPAGRELVFLPVLDPPVLAAAHPGSTVRLVDRTTGGTLADRATVRSTTLADPEAVDTLGGLWLVLSPEESDAVAAAGAQTGGPEQAVAVSLVHPHRE
ncbi:SAF domain-containing protein [Kytococcus sedentarius]|uniref:SAF domain-containing protein n=1 Tax=Kytococcus sedentarius TaxID=1276 RepID=UPI0035BC0309